MAQPRGPAQPSAKLQQIRQDFQQIATMAGFLNSAFDLPQLRLFFTLYGRVAVADEAEGLAILPRLQAWCDRLGNQLREDSSSAILPPQVQIAAPQPHPSGEGWVVVATLSFASKGRHPEGNRGGGPGLRPSHRGSDSGGLGAGTAWSFSPCSSSVRGTT